MEATQHYLVTKIPTDVRLQRILVLVISQCQHQLREQIYGQDPAKTNKTNKPNSVQLQKTLHTNYLVKSFYRPSLLGFTSQSEAVK